MQRGVSEVRKYGLVPDLLMVRDPNPISDKLKSKIAGFAHLEEHQVSRQKCTVEKLSQFFSLDYRLSRC